jgi:hypothetical protein
MQAIVATNRAWARGNVVRDDRATCRKCRCDTTGAARAVRVLRFRNIGRKSAPMRRKHGSSYYRAASGHDGQLVLVECDTSNPDVPKAYTDLAHAEFVNRDERDGWFYVVNMCDKRRGSVIVVVRDGNFGEPRCEGVAAWQSRAMQRAKASAVAAACSCSCRSGTG